MLQRPETDYERWLRLQDQNFTPEDLPLYNQDEQAVDRHEDPPENNHCFRGIGDRSWHNLQEKGSSYGYFIGPYSASPDISHMYAVLGFIILAYILAFSTALAFRKRQDRERELSRSV
jgi:hypothetical protein